MKITEKNLMDRCGLEGYFILSSKISTNKYYDVKSLLAEDHNFVIEYFLERIDSEFDVILSAELGGSLIASALSERLNKPFAILRKDRPNLGHPFGKVLIIDDVCTTHNTVNKMIKWVKDCNAKIVQIVIAIDRRKPIKKK